MTIRIMVSIMDDTANPEEEWESRQEIIDDDLLNFSRNPRQTVKVVAERLQTKYIQNFMGRLHYNGRQLT